MTFWKYVALILFLMALSILIIGGFIAEFFKRRK